LGKTFKCPDSIYKTLATVDIEKMWDYVEKELRKVEIIETALDIYSEFSELISVMETIFR